MSVYKRHFLLEVLRHDDQRVIDRAVAVRVIFTHRITDNTGALSVRSVRPDPQFVHVVESSSLHGFEAVPDIGKRSCDDYTHCVVDIGLLHKFGVFRLEDLLLRSLRECVLRLSLPFFTVLIPVVFRHKLVCISVYLLLSHDSS